MEEKQNTKLNSQWKTIIDFDYALLLCAYGFIHAI